MKRKRTIPAGNSNRLPHRPRTSPEPLGSSLRCATGEPPVHVVVVVVGENRTLETPH
jgi:hypothetical protein